MYYDAMLHWKIICAFTFLTLYANQTAADSVEQSFSTGHFHYTGTPPYQPGKVYRLDVDHSKSSRLLMLHDSQRGSWLSSVQVNYDSLRLSHLTRLAGCSKYKTFNVATPVPQAGQAVSFGLLTNLVQLRQDGGQLLLLDRQLKCIYSVNRSAAGEVYVSEMIGRCVDINSQPTISQSDDPPPIDIAFNELLDFAYILETSTLYVSDRDTVYKIGLPSGEHTRLTCASYGSSNAYHANWNIMAKNGGTNSLLVALVADSQHSLWTANISSESSTCQLTPILTSDYASSITEPGVVFSMSAVVYLSPHRLAIIDIVEKTVVLLKTPDSASDANRIEKMHFVGQVERFDGPYGIMAINETHLMVGDLWATDSALRLIHWPLTVQDDSSRDVTTSISTVVVLTCAGLLLCAVGAIIALALRDKCCCKARRKRGAGRRKNKIAEVPMPNETAYNMSVHQLGLLGQPLPEMTSFQQPGLNTRTSNVWNTKLPKLSPSREHEECAYLSCQGEQDTVRNHNYTQISQASGGILEEERKKPFEGHVEVRDTNRHEKPPQEGPQGAYQQLTATDAAQGSALSGGVCEDMSVESNSIYFSSSKPQQHPQSNTRKCANAQAEQGQGWSESDGRLLGEEQYEIPCCTHRDNDHADHNNDHNNDNYDGVVQQQYQDMTAGMDASDQNKLYDVLSNQVTLPAGKTENVPSNVIVSRKKTRKKRTSSMASMDVA